MKRILAGVLLSFSCLAQDQPQDQPREHHHMPGMAMGIGKAPPEDHAASGTSVNPGSSPMDMIHKRLGGWTFMFHGVIFVTGGQQTGPRGADKLFAPNWFMGTAGHSVRRGSVEFRTMLSVDPATITDRRYPLLFQTGETAFGVPLVDAQHPHDFVMELSVRYTRPLTESTSVLLYFAPVGDPALGPVAFPHRVSAMEIPQATLSHHVQDSTHIANDVLTAALVRRHFRFEASGFHGGEPDESRWNIDYGTIDSWATRLWWTPNGNWASQVSVGRLSHPEALEPGDVVRSTASLTYNRPFGSGNWASSIIWGRNHKTAEQHNLNSYLAESVVQFKKLNYVTGRFELVDKDELFNDQPAIRQHLDQTAGSTFRIAAYTLGYTRDLKLVPWLVTGIGGNVTLYGVPGAIQPYYGRHPAGFFFFLRARLKGAGGMAHMHHGT
ncbi:MAG TPA: hypothetical protein VMT32_21840 [Bryobacteraceae bacterium]|nr:hypothetical protein [Bryobacteraceae bacterium]